MVENRRGFLQKLVATALAPSLTKGAGVEAPVAALAAAASLMQKPEALTPAAEAFIAVATAEALLKKTEAKAIEGNKGFTPYLMIQDRRPRSQAEADSVTQALSEANPKDLQTHYADEMMRIYRDTVEGYVNYYKAIKAALETKEGFKQFSEDMKETDSLRELVRRLDTSKDKSGLLDNMPPEIAESYKALQAETQKRLNVISERYGFKNKEEFLAFRDSTTQFVWRKNIYEEIFCEAAEVVAQQFLFNQSVSLMAKKLGCNDPDLIVANIGRGYNEASFGGFREKEIELQFADMILVAATGKPVSQTLLKADEKKRHSLGTIDTRNYEHHAYRVPNLFESAGVSAQQKAYGERRDNIRLDVLLPYIAELKYLGGNASNTDMPIADLYAAKVPYIAGLNEAERVEYFNQCAKKLGASWEAELRELSPLFGGQGKSSQAKNSVQEALRPEKMQVIEKAAKALLSRSAGAVVLNVLTTADEETPPPAVVAAVAATNAAEPVTAAPTLEHQSIKTIIPTTPHTDRVPTPASSWTGAADAARIAREQPRELGK